MWVNNRPITMVTIPMRDPVHLKLRMPDDSGNERRTIS
jgi:hypothetical protein